MKGRVRMTLDLSARLNNELERLAEAKQTSKADILRFAVEFLALAFKSRSDGFHVGAWSETDTKRIEREFVLFGEARNSTEAK